MSDSSAPAPRAKLGVNKAQAPKNKDPGRKAVRPAGRKQAAGFKAQNDAAPRSAPGERSDKAPRRDGGKPRNFEDRPRRDFGDKPPRREGERSFGDRPPRRDFNDKPRSFEDRPRRDFGDRPPRREGERSFGDKPPRRDFNDRPPRNFEDRPRRDFGDRPPRREGERSFGDKPPRRDFNDKPRSFEDRPRRDFGDRPPRRDFNDKPRSFEDRPRRDFGDRPPRRDFNDKPRSFEDRPRRDFGDRPPRRDFNDKPRRAPETVHTSDFPAADTSLLNLFLPCPAGVQDLLAEEVARIMGGQAQNLRTSRGGVALQGDWAAVQRLNLHSRLALRVLIELAQTPYRQENDLYDAALALPWENWFGVYQTFKIDLTAQASPLQSLNFAALKIKDAVADRFRQATGARPNVETHFPDVRIHAHLTRDTLTLYIDSSGEPLFKRGWRQDKGDAPLKETLAAAILAASGWTPDVPLYDPCCGSGTIAIEAAQIAAGIAAGSQRSFGFERLLPFARADWLAIKEEATQTALAAQNAKNASKITIFGSDVAHRMVDFAQRNAERAGVADWVEFRGGDALQRKAPIDQTGLIVLNPPYGERIETGGFAASDLDFFVHLADHWKAQFAGWTAWVLSPDFKLPGHMHLAESRKVPMWNGPIECRLFKFTLGQEGA